MCCEKSQLLRGSHHLAPSSPDPPCCHLLTSSPSFVRALAWLPWSPLHQYPPPHKDGFLHRHDPLNHSASWFWTASSSGPRSSNPHPGPHHRPQDRPSVPLPGTQWPPISHHLSPSPVTITLPSLLLSPSALLILASHLTQLNNSLFLGTKSRQVGWGGRGVDVQLWAGQQAGDKKTLTFRSCVTRSTSQLTEKWPSSWQPWAQAGLGHHLAERPSRPPWGLGFYQGRQMDWQEGWGSFTPADAWRNRSHISSWQWLWPNPIKLGFNAQERVNGKAKEACEIHVRGAWETQGCGSQPVGTGQVGFLGEMMLRLAGVCVVTSNSLEPRHAAHQAPLSMGILQARMLEWIVMPSSRGSSQSRDRTQVSCIAGGFFTI